MPATTYHVQTDSESLATIAYANGHEDALSFIAANPHISHPDRALLPGQKVVCPDAEAPCHGYYEVVGNETLNDIATTFNLSVTVLTALNPGIDPATPLNPGDSICIPQVDQMHQGVDELFTGTKRALLIGCNYPGTESELTGCINDALSMHDVITEVFGFKPEDISLLLDDPTIQPECGLDDSDPACTLPTAARIKEKLKALLDASQSGDLLYVHFSGHGTFVPDELPDGTSDPTLNDSAVVPADFNLILDDDFRDILVDAPEGLTLIFVSDSCHSGSLLDGTPVIEGDKDGDDVVYPEGLQDDIIPGARSLSPFKLCIELTKKIGETVQLGTMRKALVNHYGGGASKAFQRHTACCDQINAGEAIERAAVGRGRKKTIGDEGGVIRPDVGILISGCQPHEVSLESVDANGNPGGALTIAMRQVIEANLGKVVTFKELVLAVRENLANIPGYDQNPCLECSENVADISFMLSTGFGSCSDKGIPKTVTKGPPPEEVCENPPEPTTGSLGEWAVEQDSLGIESCIQNDLYNHPACSREVFTTLLLYSAYYNSGCKNTVVCNLACSPDPSHFWSDLYLTATYDGDGTVYGVWVGTTGIFTKCGDGGLVNWAMMGYYEQEGETLTFKC